jgi:hypothetical protein
MAHVRCLLVILVLIAASAPAQVPDFHYYVYKQRVDLAFDSFRIAVLAGTPTVQGSAARDLQARQGSLPPSRGVLSGDMGGGWALQDLAGGASGGHPELVVALIEEIASDPTGDEFASPVFLRGDETWIVTPRVHVAFDPSVPRSTVDQAFLELGLGPILEVDYVSPNSFAVATSSRSGIATLEAANVLAQRPDVLFANVDWMFTGDRLAEAVVEYAPPTLALSAWNQLGTPPFPVSGKAAPTPLCAPMAVNPPSEPLFGQQWGLRIFNGYDIDAPGAWQNCTGSATVVVAVIDNGVQRDHPDMPNVLEGADFTSQCLSPPCRGEPQHFCDNHGTSVASVVNASSNGIGIVGVAPDVSILPIRAASHWVTGATNCHDRIHESWLVDAVRYAIARNANITSLSWFLNADEVPMLALAYRDAYDAGIFNVHAAGNGNSDIVTQPGRLHEVHSITGMNFFGDLFKESESFASNWGADVFLTAPGQYILTLDRTGDLGYEPGDHTSLTGTSFACPMVAGIAALIVSMNPSLGPREIAFILKSNVRDLGDPGWDVYFGYGLPKAGACVEMAPGVIFVSGFERGLSEWSSVEGRRQTGDSK